MFVSETTETVGLKQCPFCDVDLLERDEFAGITSIRDAPMTTYRAFHGYQPFLTISAQAAMRALQRICIPALRDQPTRGESHENTSCHF